jgi:hypothetical protein
MTPCVVGASQANCIGSLSTCGALQVFPLSSEDVNPTCISQVGPAQLGSRSK